MAHDHHHHGDSLRNYFTEQLLTIFVVGAFGAVAILMYQTDRLRFILAEPFRLPVMIGGLAVLAIVVLRALSVWKEAGAMHDHDHDHSHGHDHSHDHSHGHDHAHEHHEHGPDCDHDHHHEHDHGHEEHDHRAEDHGHSHDMAWVLARMMVLFFPVALYMVGIPNSGFSQDRINKMLGTDEQIAAEIGYVNTGDGDVVSFTDLNDAAYDEYKREYFQGKVVLIDGQFKRLGEKQFTLYTMKITCCGADMVPLKVQIVTTTAISGLDEGQWVNVKGEVRFIQRPGSVQFTPVIFVADASDIHKIPSKSL